MAAIFHLLLATPPPFVAVMIWGVALSWIQLECVTQTSSMPQLCPSKCVCVCVRVQACMFVCVFRRGAQMMAKYNDFCHRKRK